MSLTVLERDTELVFPQSVILKASAGSGKTHALTKRFVQFLLSDEIAHNHLRNVLAITFSNNAAREMKERILSWLKAIYFRDERKLAELREILSLSDDRLLQKAGTTIEEVLTNYTDFQVRTVDSFMASIYKASAIDLGYSPDFDILMSADSVMSFAFNRFLRTVREEGPLSAVIEEIIDLVIEGKGKESAYLWDPSQALLAEIREIYSRLSGTVKSPDWSDCAEEIRTVKSAVAETAGELDRVIRESGLQRSKRSSFDAIADAAKKGRFADLVGKGLKALPVNKPKAPDQVPEYERIRALWNDLGEKIRQYIVLYSRTFYLPYLRAYEAFRTTLDLVKKQQGVVFIEDINKKLADYLDALIVPDVYFRIGDTIYHYLIDEFQDTSPIQWHNLLPLIENSLSQGGSFFAVGDTKQAIYGFRNADYRIMKELETGRPFPAARHDVRELSVNYRSFERITDFNERIFQGVLAASEKYREAALQSGLLTYDQKVKDDHRGLGYVEVTLWNESDEEPAERDKLQEAVKNLRARGYRYSDLAILTLKNEQVVRVTQWLNEIGIPFISYSALDVRKRKITGEILSLLNFLDSPPDDLSFANFLMGEVFRKTSEGHQRALAPAELHHFLLRNRRERPLYKAFREEFPVLWEAYFRELFSLAGYLPLYDLVSEIYKAFGAFDAFGDEEATLVRILEVIKDFEGEGRNSLKEFLRYASDGETMESGWDIDVPTSIDAVRVMTIHKAKGLGFPVVLVLLYEEESRGYKYVLSEDQEKVRLLKVTRTIADASPLLDEAYRQEQLKEMVNRLNTLYVGLTRAEGELYVVGVRGEKPRYPTEVLPEVEFGPAVHLAPAGSTPLPSAPELKLRHSAVRTNFPVAPEDVLNIEEKQRGEFIHRALSLVDYRDERFEYRIGLAIARANRELRCDYPLDAMRKYLMEFLDIPDMQPHFTKRPGRAVRTEQEFSDPNGNLFRMDRVILDEDLVTVLDYKTGSDLETGEKYDIQLRNYMRILRDVFPGREVQGIIAYPDLKRVRRII